MAPKFFFLICLNGVPHSCTGTTANDMFRELIYRVRNGEANPTRDGWSLRPVFSDSGIPATWAEVMFS